MAPRATRARRTGATVLALALLIAVVSGVIGGVIADAIDGPSSPSPAASGSGSEHGGTATASCSIPAIAERDLRSVVTITARSGDSGSTGSGEVIRADGYIVTNNHVVAAAAGAGGTLEVLSSKGSTRPATIVGRDPEVDLAVIKVDVKGGLVPIALGSSKDLRVGEEVVALGAPLGLSSTVTSGIVSALDRTVAVPGETEQGALLVDAIQTDAAINPGNSGGALVDCSGHLVGIPSAGASVPSSSGESSGGSIGLGFAIPVDLVRTEVAELIRSGKVTHSYFGLSAQPLSAVEGAPSEGLLVVSVDPDGPAAKAGLRPDDVLLAVDGKPASSPEQLVSLGLREPPGTAVEVEYRRGGARATVKVVLAARP